MSESAWNTPRAAQSVRTTGTAERDWSKDDLETFYSEPQGAPQGGRRGVGIVGPWPGSSLPSWYPSELPARATSPVDDDEVASPSDVQGELTDSVIAARARLRDWIQRQARGPLATADGGTGADRPMVEVPRP